MTKTIPTVKEINEYINSCVDYEEKHMDSIENYRIALREIVQDGDKEEILENFRIFCKTFGVNNKGFRFDDSLFDKLIEFVEFGGNITTSYCRYEIMKDKDKFYTASLPILEHVIKAPDKWDLSNIDKDSDNIDAYYANGYFYVESNIAISLTLDKNQSQEFFDELWESELEN